MRRLAVILALLLCASSAWAWTINRNFDSGTEGATASGTYGFSDADPAVTFYSGVKHGTSGKSARFYLYQQGGDNIPYGEFSTANITENQEVWIRWYMYLPSGFQWNDTYMKTTRLHGYYANGTHAGWMGLGGYGGSYILSNEVPDVDPSYPSVGSYTLGSWVCYEMYFKVSSTDPIRRFWVNGTLVYADTSGDYVTNYTSDAFASGVQWFRTWNSPYIPTAQYAYVDDIIITTDTPSTQDSSGNYMVGPDEYVPGEDTTAPTVSSVSVGTNGTTLSVNFDETITGGTTGEGGFTVNPSGGAATVTYASGSNSTTLYYTVSRAIQYDETLTITYSKPGSAFVEDLAGNDLAAFSGTSVTNYSIQGQTGDAPVMSNLTPTGQQACEQDPQPITFGVTTNVAATCRGSLTNVDYDTMGSGANFDTTGGTTHSSVGLPGIACGSTFTLYVHCRDGSSNTTTTPGLISASVAGSVDVTGPTASSLLPTGSQTYDSGNQTISLVTDENATCRWGTLSLSDYYSYSNVMTGGGTTSHSAALTGLSEGTTYTRYGRCIDASGNQSTTFTWSWSYPASGGGLSPATLRGKFSGGYFK